MVMEIPKRAADEFMKGYGGTAPAAGQLAPVQTLPGRACVRNTFIEFEEEDDGEDDVWFVGVARRLKTDSVVERSSQSLRVALEQGSLAGDERFGDAPAPTPVGSQGLQAMLQRHYPTEFPLHVQTAGAGAAAGVGDSLDDGPSLMPRSRPPPLPPFGSPEPLSGTAPFGDMDPAPFHDPAPFRDPAHFGGAPPLSDAGPRRLPAPLGSPVAMGGTVPFANTAPFHHDDPMTFGGLPAPSDTATPFHLPVPPCSSPMSFGGSPAPFSGTVPLGGSTAPFGGTPAPPSSSSSSPAPFGSCGPAPFDCSQPPLSGSPAPPRVSSAALLGGGPPPFGGDRASVQAPMPFGAPQHLSYAPPFGGPPPRSGGTETLGSELGGKLPCGRGGPAPFAGPAPQPYGASAPLGGSLPFVDTASLHTPIPPATMKAFLAFREEIHLQQSTGWAAQACDNWQDDFEEGEPDFEEEEPEPAPSAESDRMMSEEDRSGGGSPGRTAEPAEQGGGAARKQVSIDVGARQIAVDGGGLSGYTTVMIRHIPGKYTQQKLMREINSMGFLGKYDFIYLPMQLQSRGNRSFAFVNFCTPEAADSFYRCFHGRQLRHFRAGQPVTVVPADVQGFEENAAHYASMRHSRNRRPLQSGHALFFKPLPPHLADEEEGGEEPVEAASPWGAAPGRWDQPVQQPPTALGTPVQAAAAAAQVQRFCAFCGQPKAPQHAFCAYCGARAAPRL